MQDSTSTSNNPGIGGRGKKAPYQTTLVRIPLALKSKVESLSSKYRESITENGLTTDVEFKQHEIVLNAIEAYIQYRSQNYRLINKPIDTNTRGWDELRKFVELLKSQPELLFESQSQKTTGK